MLRFFQSKAATSPRHQRYLSLEASAPAIASASCPTGDVEAPERVRRRLQPSAYHQTANEAQERNRERQEEEKKDQEWVKEQIAQAVANSCLPEKSSDKEHEKEHKRQPGGKVLLSKAEEYIKQDWLGDITALSGNIYRIAAFGRHISKHMGSCSEACSEDGVKAYTRFFGIFFVFFAQFLGPPAIFLSTVFAWGIDEKDRFLWEKFVDDEGIHLDLEDWHHIALTKVLSMILICLFCLNATFTLLNEVKEWSKIDDIFQYLQTLTPGVHLPGEKFLFLGGLTNCWVVFWCCIDAYVVIGGSLCPKDCIMDSLGLIFLFNLDDIGGDLGFVDEDAWPGLELGWVYKEMVDKKYGPPGMGPVDIKTKKRGCGARIVRIAFLFCATLTGIMSIFLPILSAITPWREIIP